jgi:hypothetical protein
MNTLLGLLGLVLIGVGVFNFFRRDWLWEQQARVNASRGRASERTDAWETRQTVIGLAAIVIGVVLIGAGFVNGAAPQAPAGDYGCLTTGEVVGNTSLVLRSDGTGTFEGQALTWTRADGSSRQVTFGGDAGIVSGDFPNKNDPKTFVIVETSGETRTCLLR